MESDLQASAKPPGALQDADDGGLGDYLSRAYDLADVAPTLGRPPLDDEPFVPIWESWRRLALERGAWPVLRGALPQLRFPIAEGISGRPEYRAAVARGVDPEEIPEATGLPIERPAGIDLELHPTPAGRIPVLRITHRPDFVTLVRALAHRNEPVPIPDSQGAAFVSGYLDWERVAALRRAWEETPAEERESPSWAAELARIKPRKELYLDRFMLLSDGPYAAVPAAEMGLGEAEWRERSHRLRRDHESTHYLTRRLFATMASHALDELAADYAGMAAALGGFRAEPWLRFLGVHGDGTVGEGARLGLYRGRREAPLADAHLPRLAAVLGAAAAHLEAADRGWLGADRSLEGRTRSVLAILTLSLERLAAADGRDALGERWRAVGAWLDATP